ncbi:hypothetical protein [Umezawaea sp. Da 62-37]|uniref:hypothetical protein n=1 Tax=Umezawaea sp. Da 62-37 TaxID=3075927 RepID=UPI0028F7265D|nr:hypothetical protein [Umezawaea sp. Da 62-37]WNV89391.1 hypothetical protein RM788_14125 [Umezawaea sp. Da 62-37]
MLRDMGVRTLLHDLTGSTDELSVVEHHRLHAVVLAPLPDGRLAKATTTALIPLLHDIGALVIAEGTTPELAQWYREIGIDLLLPAQPGADEY